MKKSTKLLKVKLFCLLLLATTLATCLSEIRKQEEVETISFGVAEARYWFEATAGLMMPREVLTRNADGASEVVTLTPVLNWNLAEMSNNSEWEVVELPWEYEEIIEVFALGEVWQYAMATNTVPENVIRLVVMRNRETEETFGFRMKIAPTLDFMLRYGENLHTKMYLDRNSNLCGIVMFYNLEGAFLNGWLYQNGNIVSEIVEKVGVNEEDLDAPTTRGMTGSNAGGWLIDEVVITGQQPASPGVPLRPGDFTTTNFSFQGEQATVSYIAREEGGGANVDASTARVTTSPIVNLGSNITLTANASSLPTGVTIRSVRFEMGRNGSFREVRTATTTSHTLRAVSPGRWEARAIVTLSNGRTLTSPTARTDVWFPDVHTIAGRVRGQMEVAWAQTKTSASTGGRHEYGFWIYADTRGGSLVFETDTPLPGRPVNCGGRATLLVGDRRDDWTDRNNPLVGGRFYVAHFHTHTPLTHCPVDYFRESVGPSHDDWIWANGAQIPGLVYDYLPIWCTTRRIYGLPGGHRINAPAQVWFFGPMRRAMP